jgi:hypothetical protein
MANRVRFFWVTGAAAFLTLASVAGCGDDDESTPGGGSGKGGSVGKGGTGGAKGGTGGTSGKGGTGGGTGGGGTAGQGGAGGAAGGRGGVGGTPDGGGGKTDGGGGTPDGSAGAPDGAAGTAGDGGAGAPGDSASETAAAATCTSYSAALTTNCNAAADRQYTGMQCEKTCVHFTQGTIGATSGNSLECRATKAAAASGDKANCDAAGPAGVGQCGTPCESYCTLMAAVCPTSLPDSGTCASICGALTDANMTSFSAPVGNSNTLACRIYHLANAAEQVGVNEAQRVLHCGHAAGAGPCAP